MQGPPYSTGNSAQSYVAAWMEGEFGGEWIHVYVWLIPFAVHLNYHNAFNRDLPNPGIEPGSPALQVDSLPFELHGSPLHSSKNLLKNEMTGWSSSGGIGYCSWLILWRVPWEKDVGPD